MKKYLIHLNPAAFGRLCVETILVCTNTDFIKPAAFGRLCVETKWSDKSELDVKSQPPSGGCVLKRPAQRVSGGLGAQPPSGGCVLKPETDGMLGFSTGPAAFGRLCVETVSASPESGDKVTSRLRAAVC